MKKIFPLMLAILVLSPMACKKSTYDTSVTANTWLIHHAFDKTTEIIVQDIFSPVVAARIYAYTSIALYETLRQGHPEYKTLAGQVKDLTEVPAPPKGAPIDINLAGIQAFINVAKAMIFSESDMEDFRTTMYADLKSKGVPDDVFAASTAYGDAVSAHILAWAGKDNYAETRSSTKYTINNDPGRWQPTPPAFIEAIEPHWRDIRPMTLDSSNQFPPLPPTNFSTDKNSLFYQQAFAVYHAADTNKVERMDIASFWDCNPYVMHQQGHLMMATKKITPGGHWISIVGLATRKLGLDMAGTSEAYAMVSIGLFDAFISCWDEKYRSNLIRPETYINRFIDPDWEPGLQTPPFPEHTSGHSVISTAAAVILTDMFGDNFAFADSSELAYDLPVRNFNSFLEASNEACISRFYGGIHYMPAIEYGVTQGHNVGQHVLAHIDTRVK